MVMGETPLSKAQTQRQLLRFPAEHFRARSRWLPFFGE
jgi:hypothetical protein